MVSTRISDMLVNSQQFKSGERLRYSEMKKMLADRGWTNTTDHPEIENPRKPYNKTQLQTALANLVREKTLVRNGNYYVKAAGSRVWLTRRWRQRTNGELQIMESCYGR